MEVLAWIFAVAILLKLVAGLSKPADWFKAAESMLQKQALLTLIMLVLALIVGYLVFANLSAAQIGTVMLFTGLLTGIAFVPYWKNIIAAAKETMSTRSKLLEKNWLAILIWAIVALCLIYGLVAGSRS